MGGGGDVHCNANHVCGVFLFESVREIENRQDG